MVLCNVNLIIISFRENLFACVVKISIRHSFSINHFPDRQASGKQKGKNKDKLLNGFKFNLDISLPRTKRFDQAKIDREKAISRTTCEKR